VHTLGDDVFHHAGLLGSIGGHGAFLKAPSRPISNTGLFSALGIQAKVSFSGRAGAAGSGGFVGVAAGTQADTSMDSTTTAAKIVNKRDFIVNLLLN
jgi:hypothetical protein